jgi:hypothetical protein
MHRLVMGAGMTEAVSAVVSGIALVLLSMIGGGIIYALVKDCIKNRFTGNG